MVAKIDEIWPICLRSWHMVGITLAGKKESIGGLSELVYDFSWRARPILA